MRFYSTIELGPKRRLTPEGFLVIEDVPLARTGQQLYGPGETPVSNGPDGMVRIERLEEEVFRPESVASLNGKPLVDDHPTEDVALNNWRQHFKGAVLNPRRGLGILDDFLIGDIIVYDKDMISDIDAGKREVSCGYDCDYEETAPGQGRQRAIIYNHVALVKHGRCGPRCAIGDHAHNPEEQTMTKKPGWREKIAAAFKTGDQAALDGALTEAEEHMTDKSKDEIHIHVNGMGAGPSGSATTAGTDTADDVVDPGAMSMDEEPPAWFKAHVESNNSRFDAIEKALGMKTGDAADAADKAAQDAKDAADKLAKDAADADILAQAAAAQDAETKAVEGRLKEEAPKGTGDAAYSVADSVALAEPFQETLAMAEILAPGIQVPTYDSAAPAVGTMDAIDGLRRSALITFGATEDGAKAIEEIAGSGKSIATMDCDCLRNTFRAAAVLKKAKNNSGRDNRVSVGGGTGPVGKVVSIADLNARNNAHYANH